MSIYSVNQNIKQQIISKIQACDAVQKVYPAEQPNPTGWPAVFVVPVTEEGEFSSNAENSRIYEYSALVLFPEGQDYVPPGEATRLDYSEKVVGQVLDQIINAIDTDFELDSIPYQCTVLYVNAADVQWGRYAYEGGVAKAAEVTLRVYTEITVV
jgi:hypothetical protein